ncbi:XRE family transcriptional regulator [Streptomyces syringium]|uniref:XRE family transcriptional regulator n=1 Tax=Streptomyces syringium TaxID=76729 RepID=UPI003AB0EDE9
MGSPGESAPHGARDAAEFVAAMRQLKARSGLTFRQLEERAAARGEVLARSTLADALRHDALPRVETLTAFLRACGEEHDAGAWLEARKRLSVADVPPGEPAPERPSRWRTRPFRVATAAAVAVLLAAGGLAGARYPRDPAGPGSARSPMLPSKGLPRHAEVCVTYPGMEACTGSDGMSRVKPYPSAS